MTDEAKAIGKLVQPNGEDELLDSELKNIHQELVDLGEKYPADSSDVRYVLQLINEYVDKKEVEARIDEVKWFKKVLPNAHLDANGCWHYESRKIDNPLAERLAQLTQSNQKERK